MVTLLQLKEKCSRQKTKLSSLREEIIDLEVRLLRILLQLLTLLLVWYIQAQLKQFEQLKEVNKRYHTHTVELKDKIAELMVISTHNSCIRNFFGIGKLCNITLILQ